MNAFCDANINEQLLDLVTYTGTLIGDASTFLERCKANIESKQDIKVMDELISHSHLFYKGGKDVESVLNSISRLICIFSPEQAAALVLRLSSALVSVEVSGHEMTRLKVLGTLFNNLPADSPSRFNTFLNLLSLVARSPRSVSVILAELPKIDSWLRDWALQVDQTRQLFKKLHEVLKACRQSKLSMQFLVKYIATFAGSAPEDFSVIKNDTVALISQALIDPETFDFSNILDLRAVQQLKNEKIYEALSVVVAGNLANYLSFQQANAAELNALGLSGEDLSRKVRLLTLSALCASNSEVSYSKIASTLLVDEVDVEAWIIDVIRVGLVEAKVDQVGCKVVISRSTHSKFDRAEWETLRTRLQRWSKHIDEVQKVLVTVRAQVQTPVAVSSRR